MPLEDGATQRLTHHPRPASMRAKPLSQHSNLDGPSCRRDVGRSIQRVLRRVSDALSDYSTMRASFEEARREEVIRSCEAALGEIDELARAMRGLLASLR